MTPHQIHIEAARVLGWSVADCRTMSLPALRDLVKFNAPWLVEEISLAIRTGEVVGPRKAPRARAIGVRR